jgi:hypothetical protein
MLATPLATICFIIVKARAFDAKVPPVDEASGSDPEDDGDVDILEDLPDDATEEELKDAIDGLDPEQQIELVALTWVGRGDFDRSEWGEALAEARRAWTSHTAAYLTGDPQLGDFLEEGLAELGYSCTDIEEAHL